MADKMSFQQKLADIMQMARGEWHVHDGGGGREVF